MSNNLHFLAKEVRELRKQAGLSQENFAERTNVSLALISEIERGIANPTVLTLEKISNYFSIPLSRLLAPEEDSANTAMLKAELHARIAAMDSTAQLRTVLKFVSSL